MSVYKSIIDNNICLSFGRGLRSDAQLYFDVKETIECADVLQTAIASCSASVSSLSDLLDYLALRKLTSLAKASASIEDEDKKQAFQRVIDLAEQTLCQYKVGEIIKYINASYQQILDKRNANDELKRDLNNAFYPTVEFCIQFQQGISEDIFLYLAENHWYVFSRYFDDLKKLILRNPEVFKAVFSEANIQSFIQTQCERLLTIAKHFSEITFDEDNLFELLNERILLVSIRIMESAEERETIIYGDSIRRIRRYFSEIAYSQEKLNTFETAHGVFDSKLNAYIDKNGSVYSHPIPNDLADQIFGLEASWLTKMIALTHTIKQTGISSNLAHDIPRGPILMDMVSHSIDTDDYFTFSKQQDIQISGGGGSALMLQVYMNKQYHEAFVEGMSVIIQSVSCACGFQTDDLLAELMAIDQALLFVKAAKKKSHDHNCSALIYGACMLIVSCIEKWLRITYKHENHIVLSDEHMQLHGLVDNESIAKVLSEGLMKAVGFFLSKYQYVGLDYRNRLAHMSDIRLNDLSSTLPFTFLYLYISVINATFMYFCSETDEDMPS